MKIFSVISTCILVILKILNLDNSNATMSPMRFYQIFLRSCSPYFLNITWITLYRVVMGGYNPDTKGIRTESGSA